MNRTALSVRRCRAMIVREELELQIAAGAVLSVVDVPRLRRFMYWGPAIVREAVDDLIAAGELEIDSGRLELVAERAQ